MTFGGPGFKNNFAQIGVYFQSLNAKFIAEEPKYTVNFITEISYCYPSTLCSPKIYLTT